VLFDRTDRNVHSHRDLAIADVLETMQHEYVARAFGQVAQPRDDPLHRFRPHQDAFGRDPLNGVVKIFQRLVPGLLARGGAAGPVGQHALRGLEEIGRDIVDMPPSRCRWLRNQTSCTASSTSTGLRSRRPKNERSAAIWRSKPVCVGRLVATFSTVFPLNTLWPALVAFGTDVAHAFFVHLSFPFRCVAGAAMIGTWGMHAPTAMADPGRVRV
jgi:hypothetical protein